MVWAQQTAGPTSAVATRAAENPQASELAVTEADRLFQVTAQATTQPPLIDGNLDDPAWQQATPLTEFTQAAPNEGEPVTERTVVRVLYDESTLYIAAMMYDREPDQIVANVLRRDERSNFNDHFVITLDTYHDHRNGYYFETNALGAKFDAQIVGEGGRSLYGGPGEQFEASWDAVWESAGQLTEEGWSVEVAIPFWSLRFDRENTAAWGINFRRAIRRKGEDSYWAPIPRQYNATRLSQSGMLLGMQGLGAPRNLQVKPFGRADATTLQRDVEIGPDGGYATDYSGDAGVDVKWAMTPNLTFDGTLNTDFAQVEADDVQINLTRFELFFPEKREFFLEFAGLFNFGSRTGGGGGGGGGVAFARVTRPSVIGFHSRRIGISRLGREVPIIGGGRLTGKIGGWSLGALSLQTEKVTFDLIDDPGSEITGVLPSTNHTVLRLRRDLGSRSNLGVLFTNQQASGGDYNRALGVDGRWAITPETTVDAWWMGTETPGLEDTSWAGQVRFQHATPTWLIEGSAMDIGEDFNPELGFVNRRGVRSYRSQVQWSPYPEATWLRNMNPHVEITYVTDRNHRLLDRRWHFDWDLFLTRGDIIGPAYNNVVERLDLPFEIVPGVIIPPGDYSWDEYNFEAVSDPSRTVDGSFTYTGGSFFDGTRKNLTLTGGARIGPRFSMNVVWNRNDVELPEGDFVTNLVRSRIAYDFSTRLFLAALIQYDNLTDQVLSNIRLNFIHTPGADLFVVYNESRVARDANLVDRTFIIKLTHLLRF